MKNDGLESAYQLVMENECKGTVKTNMKTGKGFEGEEKASPKTGDMGIQSKSAKSVKAPKEAPKDLNPGHGTIATEGKEIRDMLPTSQFDNLFKSQIVEEEAFDTDESPLEKDGDSEFNDDKGDFPPAEGDTEVGEEVDVATELRLIIDRLTEVAERLGAFEGSEEGEVSETEFGSEEGGEPTSMAPESVRKTGRVFTEAPVATKELKPLPDSIKKMTGKSFKVDSKFNVTSNKEGDKGGPGKDGSDGKLKPAKKTTFGPKMGQKVDGVKGPLGKTGAGIFDAV